MRKATYDHWVIKKRRGLAAAVRIMRARLGENMLALERATSIPATRLYQYLRCERGEMEARTLRGLEREARRCMVAADDRPARLLVESIAPPERPAPRQPPPQPARPLVMPGTDRAMKPTLAQEQELDLFYVLRDAKPPAPWPLVAYLWYALDWGKWAPRARRLNPHAGYIRVVKKQPNGTRRLFLAFVPQLLLGARPIGYRLEG